MFGWPKKKQLPPSEPPKEQFPPVPDWKPAITQSLDRIEDRLRYYTNGKKDFALFSHGTIVLLPGGLTDSQAQDFSNRALAEIFHSHPDMKPVLMDDGNILVGYKNNITANIVLSDVIEANWAEIEAEHQRALARHEVFFTPLGQNKFDAFGMKALFGRCYMFMDAAKPKVARIARCTA